MFKLQPVFLPCADPMARSGERGVAGTAVETGTGGVDSLTLEFNDTPCTSILRNIRHIALLDPEEALRLAENARADHLFEGTPLESKLHEEIAELTDRQHPAAVLLPPSSSFNPPQPRRAFGA